MLSSTFSSKPISIQSGRRVHQAVWVPVVTIFAILGLLEVFTRVIVEHGSKVQQEVNIEYEDALHIGRSPGSGKQILIIGNSLVGHGIDMDTLQSDLPPDWHVHRFWIYNTGYADWYFGIRRLFAEGSRPDVVAVVFGAMHWYSNDARGEYAAQYLFQARDLPKISAQLHLDRTAASSLFFARYSKFFALRSEIRKVLLHSLVPDLPEMYGLFQPALRHHMNDADVTNILTDRIEAFRDIVESHGASLILIVPPIPRPGDEHQDAIRIAAQRAGVHVVMPMSSSEVSPNYFADDMHLTPSGAKMFTASLIKDLPTALEQSAGTPQSQHVALNR